MGLSHPKAFLRKFFQPGIIRSSLLPINQRPTGKREVLRHWGRAFERIGIWFYLRIFRWVKPREFELSYLRIVGRLLLRSQAEHVWTPGREACGVRWKINPSRGGSTREKPPFRACRVSHGQDNDPNNVRHGKYGVEGSLFRRIRTLDFNSFCLFCPMKRGVPYPS
jgi:hypothetical protein